jgi:hypothetical protein
MKAVVLTRTGGPEMFEVLDQPTQRSDRARFGSRYTPRA